MAFIREYAYAGDPFKLRLPKKLRKLKVGRGLGNILKGAARIGASFLPGPLGNLAEQIISPAQVAAAQPMPELYAPEAAQAFAAEMEPDATDEEGPTWMRPPLGHPAWEYGRAYGWDMGDSRPGGKGSKRKGAASGPKAKAAGKKAQRARKAQATIAQAPRGKAGGRKGGKGAAALGALRGATKLAAQFMPSKEVDFGAFQGFARQVGGGSRGGRRSINPSNVKALRRGLRRVEAFEKLVKRVEKQYPRLKRAVGHGPAPRAFGKKRCA
jgi:hypothetical protein